MSDLLESMKSDIEQLKEQQQNILNKLNDIYVALNGSHLNPDSGYITRIKELEKDNKELKEEINQVRNTLTEYSLKAKWFGLGLSALGAGSLYQLIQTLF